MPIFQRRIDPPIYADYRAYKQILRQDFKHRCAYCLLHEGDEYGAGFHNFQIDHFRPRFLFPQLEATYTNLYYACRWCNGAKSETWPSNEQANQSYRFVDPCLEDLYQDHARLDAATGKLLPKSNPGIFTVREIRLNRKMFTELRLRRIAA